MLILIGLCGVLVYVTVDICFFVCLVCWMFAACSVVFDTCLLCYCLTCLFIFCGFVEFSLFVVVFGFYCGCVIVLYACCYVCLRGLWFLFSLCLFWLFVELFAWCLFVFSCCLC